MSTKHSDPTLVDYLDGRDVLIVDTAMASCAVLARFLEQLGCTREQIHTAYSFEEAREELAKDRTKLIFSEFSIGDQYGIDLLQEYKQMKGEANLFDIIFIIVSGDSAQYKVSMSVEELVDSYIIKPYSFETVRLTIEHVLIQKLKPTLYRTLIEEGKNQLFKGNIADALKKFSLAMKEDKIPTLACFYSAQAKCMQSSYSAAEKKYSEALALTPFYLEGLIGLFDLLMKQKKHLEAYDTLKSLVEYFPGNEQRLQAMLELTIITENFHDIDVYWKIYTKLDRPSEKLTKHFYSAILVSAKFYLKQKMKVRAVELFQTAISIATDLFGSVLYSIDALSQYQLKDESALILKECNIHLVDLQRDICAYYIDSMDLDPEKLYRLLDQGLKLTASGNDTPGVYERLITQLGRADQFEEALKIASEARKKWPALTDRFNGTKAS